jgi:hypothetical protein
MVCLIFLLAIPRESRAADASEIKFTPQVSIDSTFQKGTPTSPSIAKYIQSIYNYAIGIVGILAAVVLMFGGVRWLLAGGSPDKISDAKAWIGASITGLVLVLTSYMILNTINPDLVSFKEIAPPTVSEPDLTNAGKIEGCVWKILIGETWDASGIRTVTEQKCEDFNLVKQNDYECEEKTNPLVDTCCCPSQQGASGSF